MARHNPKVDAYIAKSAAFAKPILAHLRELVHRTCPGAEEEVKWGMPFFTYQGLLCNLAAFKAHCAFGFWKGAAVFADGDGGQDGAMGQFGRITDLSDLPSDKVLAKYIRKAMELNEKGVPSPARSKRAAPAEVAAPADLAAALKRDKAAAGHWKAFTPGKRKDYVEWLEGAKAAATRARRLETALAWIAEGKPQNWKYLAKR